MLPNLPNPILKVPNSAPDNKPGPVLFFILAGIGLVAATVILIGDKAVNEELRELELQERITRLDEDSEQYVLLAEASGYYECCNCEQKQVFLNYGEIWKYGSTSMRDRYSDS